MNLIVNYIPYSFWVFFSPWLWILNFPTYTINKCKIMLSWSHGCYDMTKSQTMHHNSLLFKVFVFGGHFAYLFSIHSPHSIGGINDSIQMQNWWWLILIAAHTHMYIPRRIHCVVIIWVIASERTLHEFIKNIIAACHWKYFI